MLYFAYGSNMDWNQMRDRCPSAKFIGVAKLPNHRLAFTRKSESRDCGVADAVVDQNSSVWGVVYEIDDRDIGLLNISEGYISGRARSQNCYYRKQQHVFQDGDDVKPLAACVYVAVSQENPPLPNQTYKGLILNGARFWRLPEDYIREVLEPIEVKA
ncbi:MAG: gamma-glutamylcyclotransferase [Planctomycetes bacterium]|nr:gamma-glutamylcyclotransferase [Planctomycetota bacterium]